MLSLGAAAAALDEVDLAERMHSAVGVGSSDAVRSEAEQLEARLAAHRRGIDALASVHETLAERLAALVADGNRLATLVLDARRAAEEAEARVDAAVRRMDDAEARLMLAIDRANEASAAPLRRGKDDEELGRDRPCSAAREEGECAWAFSPFQCLLGASSWLGAAQALTWAVVEIGVAFLLLLLGLHLFTRFFFVRAADAARAVPEKTKED